MATTPDHEIAIIGAGLTGLGTASALLRAGHHDFVVLERADDVGGTWRDNTYPGVGVDVPTFAYQFRWETKPDWSRMFAEGHEVKTYIDHYVEKYGIRDYIEFGVDVTSRTWDDDAHVWRLATADGREITARFVISAVGSYVAARPVEIPGLDDFERKLLYSMDWDHAYDLTGKRVAVIGTGATGVQIIPTIAPTVAHLDVYQRTPIWIVPKIDPKIPRWLQRILARRPRLARATYDVMNLATEYTLVKVITKYARVKWMHRLFEGLCRWEVKRRVPDPQLRERLTPKYRFGCKRPSLSNSYLQTFSRDNVDLVTDPIERITASGLQTRDGKEREVDAIVMATGFLMAWDPRAYVDRPVRGSNGFDLGTHFATDRLKAYEGLTMPGLPNYFMVFSAYSAVGGSWHPIVETSSRHAIRVIEECQRRDATKAEVKQEAVDRHHAFIETNNANNLLYHCDCTSANTYYYDHHGDAPVMRPTTVRQAIKASRTFPLDDYAYSTVATRPTIENSYAGVDR